MQPDTWPKPAEVGLPTQMYLPFWYVSKEGRVNGPTYADPIAGAYHEEEPLVLLEIVSPSTDAAVEARSSSQSMVVTTGN